MRRRHFVTLVGAAAVAWPVSARAQRAESMRLVGMLMPYTEGDAEGQALVAAFQRRLQDLGLDRGPRRPI
jgi:hypothetical protein